MKSYFRTSMMSLFSLSGKKKKGGGMVVVRKTLKKGNIFFSGQPSTASM